MADSVHARAMKRAADLIGGKSALRERLRVPMHDLERWMDGSEKPPMDAFLKAVDIISAVLPTEVQRARDLRGKAEALIARSSATQQRSAAMRQAILEREAEWAKPGGAVISALAFLEARFQPHDGRAMVEAALDAAIAATGADMGNVQLTCAEGLRLVAQRGFAQPFLDFYAVVAKPHCACGAAFSSARRFAVADVRCDPLFAGTEAGQVMVEASAIAVQSTPLVGPHGVLGMISTHYTAPHQLTERESDVLDHIARRAAFWLEGGALA